MSAEGDVDQRPDNGKPKRENLVWKRALKTLTNPWRWPKRLDQNHLTPGRYSPAPLDPEKRCRVGINGNYLPCECALVLAMDWAIRGFKSDQLHNLSLAMRSYLDLKDDLLEVSKYGTT